jgi:hypothetical protein
MLRIVSQYLFFIHPLALLLKEQTKGSLPIGPRMNRGEPRASYLHGDSYYEITTKWPAYLNQKVELTTF